MVDPDARVLEQAGRVEYIGCICVTTKRAGAAEGRPVHQRKCRYNLVRGISDQIISVRAADDDSEF